MILQKKGQHHGITMRSWKSFPFSKERPNQKPTNTKTELKIWSPHHETRRHKIEHQNKERDYTPLII